MTFKLCIRPFMYYTYFLCIRDLCITPLSYHYLLCITPFISINKRQHMIKNHKRSKNIYVLVLEIMPSNSIMLHVDHIMMPFQFF